MCGITGYISLSDNKAEPSLVQKMNDKISHRGPDDHGVFCFENVGLGHRRLSIIDLSKDGHQPMHYLDRYVITYNGEVYNYLELKEELKKNGYSFKSTSDTEVILAAYDCWGEDCLHKFNGMWSFIILDKKNRTLFCSRDRYAIKPFYYTKTKGKFLIGSEIKQFTALDDFRPTLDHTTAYYFLRRGILNQDDVTFFDGVKMLKGGHQLKYNLRTHEVTIKKWYDINKVQLKNDLTFEEAKQQFFDLFQNSISLRMRSDVTVGSCLSGGMDSSSIVCMTKQILSGTSNMETISSCFTEKKYDEQEYIDQVLKYTSYKGHKVFPTLDDLFEKNMLDTMVYHQDQPVVSASHYAEYCVFQAAKKNNLTVMLDGQGADEILAGYMKFFPAHYTNLIWKMKISKLLKELKYRKELHHKSAISALSEISRYVIPTGMQHFLITKALGVKAIPDWYDINKATNLDKVSILGKNHRTSGPIFREKVKDINVHNLSKLELTLSSVPYQCHSEDKNSMAHSIESRMPFLDYKLVEFSLSLPDHFKIRNGQTKAVLRESMRPYLPPKVVNRHNKMGFVTPQEVWMKKYQNRIREEITNAVETTNGLITPEIIKAYDKNLSTSSVIKPEFFRVLSFSRWLSIFNVNL